MAQHDILIVKGRPSLVIADLGMPMMMGGQSVSDAGIRLLQQVRQEDPDTAVIVASGMASVGIAIASLKLGAYAFLMKPPTVDELLITAQRAIERRELMIERRQYPPADMVQREVLIVDDDPQVREVVRVIFLGRSCFPHEACERGRAIDLRRARDRTTPAPARAPAPESPLRYSSL